MHFLVSKLRATFAAGNRQLQRLLVPAAIFLALTLPPHSAQAQVDISKNSHRYG